jgi:hypothetical protein
LRDALGGIDPATGEWKPKKPDVHALDHTPEPHDRGAILVAAIFAAFLKVYRARTVDLYRIATEGTGILREGEIHPDLVNRLAAEAARSAQQILQMCIRAIDYCPPVGITFGDYLRAIVTADADFSPDDPLGYRLAFVESFRQWGIHPPGMRSMSVEALLWPTGEAVNDELELRLEPEELRALFTENHRLNDPDQTGTRRSTRPIADRLKPWTLDSDRYQTWEGVGDNAAVLWSWLIKGKGRKLARAIGLVLDEHNPPPTVFRSGPSQQVAVEVHSVRTAIRRTPRGAPTTDLVVEITQRRRGYFDAEKQKQQDEPGNTAPIEYADFLYRAGCTLAFDFARKAINAREPFALLHREAER